MKNIYQLSLFLSVSLLFGQELFDPYAVHTLDIQFYNPDYDQILQDRWEVDDKTYELATIIFNGETMDSVGVRYKGNSTFYFVQLFGNPKFPLNIDFNLIDNDQELLGYNKVKLSNSIFDPTFVKESVGYLTEGYYLPTPEVGYMKVSVDGELLGLYVAVESVDSQFLTKHFGNSGGTFFKCEPQFHFGDPYNTWPDLRWYGSDSLVYDYQMGYELKSESGWNDLLELIYTLNFDMENIETILNVDRALWYFAASTVMPDLDAYNGMYIHNYYLYKNTSSDLFEVIPWDKDNTFGGAMINTILDLGGDASTVYEWDPFLYDNDEERPLFSQLMTVPLYKKIYSAHIRTIIEDIYNVPYFQSLAFGIQDIIETDAQNDPNPFPSFSFGDYFQYNVDNYLTTWDGAHWCGITSTVDPRLDYLINHDEISKIPPAILNVVQEITNPTGGEDVGIQAEITGTVSVELLATNNSFPAHFISIPMFDDGEHGDGAANDNVFGAVIPFQDSGDNVKYYIRAGNDDALSLNPQKAEQEFYEYTIGTSSLPESTVVINEINYHSADDFDPGDWVELYNPTSELIDIGNWLFKDEDNDHMFSIAENTFLAPDQYLVLCNDTTSFIALFPGVNNFIGNLDFGFSGGGELLRLFDSNGSLVDTVFYDDTAPWPEEPDGNGPTLELINSSFDNALAANWSASTGYGSPGSINTVSGGQENFVISYSENWNLVGLPAVPADPNYLSLFPDAIEGTLYYYEQSYQNASDLTAGRGYWLRFNSAGTADITGTPINEISISLLEGWNLISGISVPLDVNNIDDPNAIIISGTIYGFDGGYVLTQELIPGDGYWLRAYEDGVITLNSGSRAKEFVQDDRFGDDANTLVINGSKLYFGIELSEKEMLRVSLPPAPPDGAFDVRFKGGWSVVNDYGEIEIMNPEEMLTINYDLAISSGEDVGWVLTSKSGVEYPLNCDSEFKVPSEERFTLEKRTGIPLEFALNQNYPNPFNPTTTIQFTLQMHGNASLQIYDITGRLVETLVNGKLGAGTHSVVWDAPNVSSGVYFYSIRTENAFKTRKMILLK